MQLLIAIATAYEVALSINEDCEKIDVFAKQKIHSERCSSCNDYTTKHTPTIADNNHFLACALLTKVVE